MNGKDIKLLRNIGLAGHGGCGKTSLASAILFNAGAVNRLGRVEDGTTVTDYTKEEINRQYSILSGFAHCQVKENMLSIIDTPGFGDFVYDAKPVLSATEGAVIVVCGVSGVEVFTEKVWDFADDHALPRLIFINKLDRERGSFNRTLKDLKESFNRTIIPMQLPIGSEASFSGVIDLVRMKGYKYESESSGRFSKCGIPEDMRDAAESARNELMEAVAESDDDLLETFFENGELTEEELTTGLVKAVRKNLIVPVFCGSATRNIGVAHLTQAIIDLLPPPDPEKTYEGTDPQTETVVTRKGNSDESVSAFVFKTLADPFSGKISIIKVRSGIVSSDSNLYNARRRTDERIGQLFYLQGKAHEAVDSACAGEIVAVAKLKATLSGDTLTPAGSQIVYAEPVYPPPLVSFAVKPKSRGDEEKINFSLKKLAEEDQTFSSGRHAETKEQIISGMGNLHIEVIVEKLKNRFNVEVDLEIPTVPYKETIRGKTEIQGKYKKQTGGRGQYGDTWLKIEPLPRGSGFEFVNAIVGGVVPRQYIPAVEKGIIGAMEEGILAGFPVVDIRVTLFDGSFHPVDSSEMAFKIAGSMGFKKGFVACKPVLLEPIMNVDVIIPEEFTGDIMGDLNAKRGRVLGIEGSGKKQVIKASVPLAEIQKYSSDLRSITGGRGTYTMEFGRYEEAPANVTEKVIAEGKKEDEG